MSLDDQNRPGQGVHPQPSPPPSDRTALYTLAGVIGAATIAFIASQQTARTSFDAQMVEIGVTLLSADPGKSDVVPARKWAIDLVEKHSGQPFNADDRQSLLHHPIQPSAFPAIPGFEYNGVPCSSFKRLEDGSWSAPVMQDGKMTGEYTTYPPGSMPAMLLKRRCGAAAPP